MCYIEKEKLGEIKQSDQDRNREGRTRGIGNAERSLHVNNLEEGAVKERSEKKTM